MLANSGRSQYVPKVQVMEFGSVQIQMSHKLRTQLYFITSLSPKEFSDELLVLGTIGIETRILRLQILCSGKLRAEDWRGLKCPRPLSRLFRKAVLKGATC